MEKWMDGLKAGDEVIVSRGHGAGSNEIEVVTKATKTMIVVGSARFSRKTGRMIGPSGWGSVRIGECTQEAKDEIARNKEEGVAKYRLGELYDRRNHLSDAEMDWLITAMRQIEVVSDAEDE